MDCREAFEKWVTKDGQHAYRIERYAAGDYKFAEDSWEAWQAAWECRGRLEFGELS